MEEDIAISDTILSEQEWFSEEFVIDVERGVITRQ
jgi:hypothetical protein